MSTVSLSLPSDGQTIDAADVNTPLNAIAAVINGNIDDTNIVSGANINGTKLLAASVPATSFDATARSGWRNGILAAPNTITYNGNRNYSVVFNSVDYTGSISNGMRLRFTRTVTAPTQSTSLNGTTQYYSKTTPTGISFTTTFSCMGWVKLAAYQAGGVIARRNGSTEGWSFGVNANGQLEIGAFRIASNNRFNNSAQSIPLNKWVHIAATMDVSVAGSGSGAYNFYIDGVLVPSGTETLTGTITALVQGTTALVVGSQQSAGLNFFSGKIAQAGAFSSVLSAATIASYASQTLSGAESTNVAAFSLNGVITDLNANANNLTAQGSAVATNPDSPFANGASTNGGYTAGTTEFGIVQTVAFSTNTTVVVQVPEAGAIPTSGGVSAVAYSTAKAPLGFPIQRGKWIIEYICLVSSTKSSPSAAVWYNGGNNELNMTIPIGEWIAGYSCSFGGYKNTAIATGDMKATLSTANNSEIDRSWTSFIGSEGASSTLALRALGAKSRSLSLTSATTYYLNISTSASTVVEIVVYGSLGGASIFAENAYL